MPGTFTQIYIHAVFAVNGRNNFLRKPWRTDVFRHMSGIIKNRNQKSIIINGVSDHVHLFVGLKPSICISDLIRDIKNNTTNYINENKFLNVRFSWQKGYGAFSCSHSHLNAVYNYILNQESHHHKKTFREEYLELLKKYEIRFDEKFLFEWI